MAYLNWIHYWRNSLADTDSGKGILKTKDLEIYHRIERNIFSTGQIQSNHFLLQKLFKGVPEDILALKVLYRPIVYDLRLEHGKERHAFTPEIISPILCPIWISRSGLFFAADVPYIPRDLLAPQTDDKFTLASVAEQDAFLSTGKAIYYSDSEIAGGLKHGSLIAQQKENWSLYYELSLQLYSELKVKERINQANRAYIKCDQEYFIKFDDVIGASRHILTLYNELLDNKEAKSDLLETYTLRSTVEHNSCLEFTATISDRIGHSNSRFPLAQAQRDALSHTVSMLDSDILAVNGPPGTGKTTFVLSVIASLWVKAALDESDPPLIIAASTNNQAVTNIIDAFGKDFDEGQGNLQGRWLPGINSYGGYFPSSMKIEEASKKYQTIRFYFKLESLEYLEHAEDYFLEKAQDAFPEENFTCVHDAQTYLHQLIVEGKHFLAAIEDAWNKYEAQRLLNFKLMGEDPEQYFDELEQSIHELEAKVTLIQKDLELWRSYLANESIWLGIFSWLPACKKKMQASRKNCIATNLSICAQQIQCVPNQLENELELLLLSENNKLGELHETFANHVEKYMLLQELQQHWVSLIENIMEQQDTIPTVEEVDSRLDITVRFELFRLAVHYWEARWLLECRKDADNLEDNVSKTGLKTVIPRWQRRMMLTPCIVSTFHSLPSYMTYQYKVKDEGFQTRHLINHIDLLIVDEAGQVSPEVAGAAFSLAKKALVIGDIYQIEPVRSLNKCIDIGNLKHTKVIQQDQDYEAVQESGRGVLSGSVMHIAQKASRFHYIPEAEEGMFLQEHRRCFDELISYCNELCYKGLLLPKRGSSKTGSPFPTFGYLHIDGFAESFGGSKQNLLEAQTIAAWLAANRSKIESYFNEPLEKAVGVVTPFSSQVRAISNACRTQKIKVGSEANALTIGTVHALQGAERKLIIFSQVYSKHSDGGFIDMNATMLNVAVSRAKDSFLVFGDMDVMSAAPKSSPRNLLSKYLFQYESNEIRFDVGRRLDLLQYCAQPKLLNNAKEHDEFIFKLLEEVRHKIDIVSPWVIYDRLVSTGILKKLEQATLRKIKITIYTDQHFNTTIANKPDQQKSKDFENICLKLKSIGVNVNVLKGIHSKLIFADDNCMTVGSYNWFSAAREGKYAYIETSLIYMGNLKSEISTQLDFLNSIILRKYSCEPNELSVET